MKYTLFDLEITVIGDEATYNCSHKAGDTLVVQGENFSFKKGTKRFSHYSFAALIPIIAAKQRQTAATDWMDYETDLACPDPQCGARFRFKRLKQTVYNY